MISLLVYQIQAVWQFCIDNNFTPYVTVDTTQKGVNVPVNYIKEGKIILNLSPTAVSNLRIDPEYITFKARFNGTSFDIIFPIESVLSIYSKETLEGVILSNGDPTRTWDSSPQIKARSPRELKAISEIKSPKPDKDKPSKPLKILKDKNPENIEKKGENIVSLEAFRSRNPK